MKLSLRVAVIDDHALVVSGISHILSQAGHVVLSTKCPEKDWVRWLFEERADAITLDLGMPGMNGLQLAQEVRKALPKLMIIVVTQQTDKAYLRAALQAGALGFVSKQAAGTELLQALTAAGKGRLFISTQVLDTRSADRAVLKKVLYGQSEVLTVRQQAVLQHIADGKTMKEIALAMRISVKTVEFHKRSLVEILGISTTADLTKYAIAHGHAFLPM